MLREPGEAESLPPPALISGCSVERVPPGDFLTCPMKCMLMWSFSFSTDCSLKPQRMQQNPSGAAAGLPGLPLGFLPPPVADAGGLFTFWKVERGLQFLPMKEV